MLTAWRLVKTRYLAHAFDGEGARRYGGRWNSPGVAVVYLAETLSLAALEVLVHLQSAQPFTAYSAVPVHFASGLVHAVRERDLPSGWQRWPAPPELQAVGDSWAASGKSALLAVPSAVVPEERIFLVNPAHRDFRRLRIGEAQPFAFDARLKPRHGGG